jgi:hypothetical protein
MPCFLKVILDNWQSQANVIPISVVKNKLSLEILKHDQFLSKTWYSQYDFEKYGMENAKHILSLKFNEREEKKS